ncbi:FIG00909729: hypothetical protein, partial [hydrothermal vent metagenome]
MRIYPDFLPGFGRLILTLLFATGMATHSLSVQAGSLFYTESESLHPLTVASAAELEEFFARQGYQWPPGDQVPAIALQRLPPDFADIRSSTARKHLFLRTLLPIVLAENRRLREQRQLVLLLLKNPPLADEKLEKWLAETARKYRIRSDLRTAENRVELLKRLDEIPTALTLAQAAIESGWGTSRFALEGNSLFGQWTYQKTGGLTPANRAEDATHSVKAFPNLQASVRAYMHNLNIGHAYDDLRDTRARLHADGQKP